MRCRFMVTILLCMILAPCVSAQTEGRSPPGCLERDIADISNSISIDSGICWKINLGSLQPGDVYDVEVNVITDAIDILFFDQVSIQSYDLGQSYRSQFDNKSSTENALGGYNFHWKVPPSINPKVWYLVLDNLDHAGDQGQGDQGGITSQISLDFTKLQDSYWTPYHDVMRVSSESFETLLSGDDLKLDAGTTIVLTAWALEGAGDVYLQTKQMNDLYVSGGIGQLYITTTEMQDISSSDSTTWVVPAELENQELVLIVDNTDNPVGGGDGSEDIRMTVRVQLAPPISPFISADNSGITSIGVGLNLDSMNTPNLLDQIETMSWDFDSQVDSDGDSIFDNDADAEGWQVVGTWDSPGQKTVTLTATSRDQQISKTTSTITVQDIVSPVAVISSSGQTISAGWKVGLNEDIAFSCGDSTDDDSVEACIWTLDGEVYDQNTSIVLSWPNIGPHTLVLTVADSAGNSNSISENIVVFDSSVPVLDQSKLELLPDSAVEDSPLEFSAIASDDYDQPYQLTYHWDLDPNFDSDGNGDAKDDPNYIGSSVEMIFEKTGKNDVVLTVFDQSGNKDSHPFSVTVNPGSEPTSVFGIVIVVLFIGVITMAISMIGYRRWQKNIAIELLSGRGLSQSEAKQHIRMVSQKMKVPIFAPAAVIAGLKSEEPVVTSEDRAKQAEKAQYESIYGVQNQDPNLGFAPQTTDPNAGFAPQTTDPNAGFAPQTADPNAVFAPSSYSPQPMVNQISQGSQAAANAALEMFAEDETESIIESRINEQSQPAIEAKVNSGGIELPQSVKSQIKTPESPKSPEVSKVVDDTREITCPECNHTFRIRIPKGVPQAVVECPSCKTDFGLDFS